MEGLPLLRIALAALGAWYASRLLLRHFAQKRTKLDAAPGSSNDSSGEAVTDDLLGKYQVAGLVVFLTALASVAFLLILNLLTRWAFILIVTVGLLGAAVALVCEVGKAWTDVRRFTRGDVEGGD